MTHEYLPLLTTPSPAFTPSQPASAPEGVGFAAASSPSPRHRVGPSPSPTPPHRTQWLSGSTPLSTRAPIHPITLPVFLPSQDASTLRQAQLDTAPPPPSTRGTPAATNLFRGAAHHHLPSIADRVSPPPSPFEEAKGASNGGATSKGGAIGSSKGGATGVSDGGANGASDGGATGASHGGVTRASEGGAIPAEPASLAAPIFGPPSDSDSLAKGGAIGSSKGGAAGVSHGGANGASDGGATGASHGGVTRASEGGAIPAEPASLAAPIFGPPSDSDSLAQDSPTTYTRGMKRKEMATRDLLELNSKKSKKPASPWWSMQFVARTVLAKKRTLRKKASKK